MSIFLWLELFDPLLRNSKRSQTNVLYSLWHSPAAYLSYTGSIIFLHLMGTYSISKWRLKHRVVVVVVLRLHSVNKEWDLYLSYFIFLLGVKLDEKSIDDSLEAQIMFLFLLKKIFPSKISPLVVFSGAVATFLIGLCFGYYFSN